jgi:hypothetical protein
MCADGFPTASVTQDKTGQLHIVKGIHDKDSLAWGTYRYATKERGWDIVDITTSFHPQYTEADKFYAAGYLEGSWVVCTSRCQG